jgi:hypothetical protein
MSVSGEPCECIKTAATLLVVADLLGRVVFVESSEEPDNVGDESGGSDVRALAIVARADGKRERGEGTDGLNSIAVPGTGVMTAPQSAGLNTSTLKTWQ